METVRLDPMMRPDANDDPRRSLQGCSTSFETFYGRELAGQVRRAKLLLGSDEAANDVVHEAFTAMYERWDSIREPGPYLNTAVLNRCRDRARHAVTASTVHRRLAASHTEDPDDLLWDAIGALPFNQRACVVLRYYAGLSEREIAETLQCKPGSVGPWTTRALTTMRKALS